MKSQILTNTEPRTVRVYEEPEIKDAIPWFFMILGFFVVIFIGFYFTNQDLIVPGIAISTVILLPFFVNRFLFRRSSIGGESFKIQRYSNDILLYRGREYDVNKVKFELIVRKMNYGRLVMLYLINNSEEIKMRSDYIDNLEKSTIYNLANTIENHLGIEIEMIEE